MARSNGKPGSKSVNPASRGSSPSGNVAGGPGKVVPQKPFQGPAGSGQPSAMRKALTKKSPGKGNAFPGTVR